MFDLAFHGIPYVPGNCDKQKLASFDEAAEITELRYTLQEGR